MAAVTFSGFYSPVVVEKTLGSSNVCTRIDLPKEAKVVTLYFRTNAGKLSTDQTLTDTGALGSADYMTIPADTHFSFAVNGDRKYLFVASATGSTVVEILVEG